MSLPASQPVIPPADSTTSTQPTTANPTTAGNVAAGTQNYTAATKVGNMDQLKNVSPQLYQGMLEGIALTICTQMQDSQNRLHDLMHEEEQEAAGGG